MLQHLQALDAPVVHDLDGHALVVARLAGQRDRSPVGFDPLFVNLGLKVLGKFRPADVPRPR